MSNINLFEIAEEAQRKRKKREAAKERRVRYAKIISINGETPKYDEERHTAWSFRKNYFSQGRAR